MAFEKPKRKDVEGAGSSVHMSMGVHHEDLARLAIRIARPWNNEVQKARAISSFCLQLAKKYQISF